MSLKAVEVGFVSTHMSPDYDKLNAIDIGYSSFENMNQRKEFISKLEDLGVRIIDEPYNSAIHLEISQTNSSTKITIPNKWLSKDVKNQY
jgi:hypothetical protein